MPLRPAPACLLSLVLVLGLALRSSAEGTDSPKDAGTKPVAAQEPAPVKRRQFLGILRLAPKYHDDSAFTAEAQAAVGRHFQRLVEATKDGRVLLAGRTSEPNDKTLGLVVFEAVDLAEAEKFMAEDPAVVAGVMVSEVRPYQVAVMRSRPPGEAKGSPTNRPPSNP